MNIASRTTIAVIIGAFAGCGGEPERPTLYPVSGTVLIDGVPAAGGTVSLRNDEGLQPSSVIGSDGTYAVKTGGKEGAPAGSYRVIVFVTERGTNGGGGNSGLPRVIGNKKYLDPSSTPLRIEVKDSSSSRPYDLKVTR